MTDEKKNEQGKRLSVAKIYIKDLSFESPLAPKVFSASEWSPKTNLNLRSSHSALQNDLHEVVLTITVDAKEDDNTVFLVELHQAGLFEAVGYADEELGAIFGSYCPNLLFPYARESIANLVQKGGFPEFILQPINFDALYAQSLEQRAAAARPAEDTH